ncbi:MAG: HsdR family type I site-specific deoxyribonuclease [Nitrospiraceae bacterium]|nr:HsdR family type I site-specific deoxyribonuclease [Nitrospiraceae bacterium]
MAGKITESVVEEAALGWFGGMKYAVIGGPNIAPGELYAERGAYDQVVLTGRLKQAIDQLNSEIPEEAKEEALRKVLRVQGPSLVASNRIFHKMLTDGVDVEYLGESGRIIGDKVWLIDFENPDNNDWLAVNQFTVVEGQHNRRPDIVVFINGLPLVVIELKNPADEEADIWTAWSQLQTYKHQIPSLMVYNEVLLISDGLLARVGSLTADKERFMPWRTVDGKTVAPNTIPQLQVLMAGLMDRQRFLDYVRHFVVFEDDSRGNLQKKIAGYHQFHAVQTAVETTVAASRPTGDRRCGVVWHTQGAGKSLTMVFFAGKIVLHPAMENPTLVVLTDRNDLDDQLFGTFSRCSGLLRQTPAQAGSRTQLRELLNTASGGIVFTTIQKFMPDKDDTRSALSGRRNIVVIADEAHRSQYDFIDGYARHMRDALPNASFIGFTGTPIEMADRSTRAVFGDHISVYDIQRAVEDGATVHIYYEGRLAKLDLKEAEKPKIDPKFEEVTEGEEVEKKEKLKTRWARLEAMVGTGKRIGLIAKDLVEHFDCRLEAMDGKAMVVGMSRRICVDLYSAIVKLRPQWHADEDQYGAIKVVMTGSATDPVDWQQHIRSKSRREDIANRFRDSDDPLRMVIVRDMWLTGFDVPCLHTMYVDKPMHGHTLMQAIARVNRVFRDKPGGLIVDYLGLASQLQKAMASYTQSGGEGNTTIDQEQAVAVMLEKYEICRDLFHGFDYGDFKTGTPEQRLAVLPAAQEHILAQEDGAARLIKAVNDLSRAFALSVPHEKAMAVRDDVAFFQTVRSALRKTAGGGEPGKEEELDHAIRQIVSRAVASDKVIDIFSAAGLKKPDISILSDEFLAEVKDLPHRNLAVELLRRLIADEVKSYKRKNLVQARSFAEMLERTIRAYQNRSIETAAVIQELIELAQDMRAAHERGEALGLREDELAFYDALEVNDSAVKVLGDEALRKIAQELVETVRRNVTIDWTVKESVRAKLRAMVKRVLRKYKYPPDKQEQATQTVLAQAELLCADVAA